MTLTNTYGSVIYAFRFRLYTRDFANSNQTDYMYQPVALFIGLRYMRGRAADRFGRFVSWLSTIGITLGVMALVTVLSVMNGFERELQNNILGLMPQAILSAEHGSLNPNQVPEKAVVLQGVNRIAPLTTGDVVLQSARSVAVGVMLGIDPAQKDPLTPYLVNVKQSELQPGKYNVILGEQLAGQLGVNRGDQIRVMVPSASQFTPMGRLPSQRLFTVIGTFAANSEVDGYEMLVNIQDASRLMRYPAGHITGWRLWLDEPLKVDTLSQQTLPSGTKWQDWRERKGELFQAVRMEKNMMGLLLSLIVAVAAFNIITSLGLMVMEKQGEVAILQTQGLTPRQIMMVFMVQGASAGIIGALLGAALGALLASQLNNLMPIIGAFLDGAALPVAIEPLQVIVIALVAMAIALLSTLYPSWRAAATQPAEALRYE
ncbi:lipoprotein-releasing ABC transporter permease subunit LolC [Salmonella bongori]|nr:lipoprotein-releasing ABC transporter permease subunit LolC [Salmonella bongori]TNB50122.1 lipoprotein-releasing ABC transporter permease subunit LolC [Salmonella bongori serovar 48:z35:-]ECI3519345.1 lipoprotein-releasing ABC transporter permease subunit LolC [Salmonella bongori]EDP8574631.1 lipoprotein-releasing ABC transporter permease subunit LolC [Salmonella bongori]EDP8594739.1 lipoprotein-releasing ABC transporter permease subunit LolC [Salmonella bongori]